LHCVRIFAPKLALRSLLEKRELPRMDTDDARDPARGGRDTRDFHHRIDELDKVDFFATPARGLQRPDKPAFEQQRPCAIAEPPQSAVLHDGFR